MDENNMCCRIAVPQGSKLRTSVLLTIALLLSGFGYAIADQGDISDLTLEQLINIPVIQTPKFAVNAEFTPSSISVLTRTDIRAFGWRTLADALRSLNGYTITSDHTYSYVGVRGISAPGDYKSRLQLLIDGIPVNENIYGSANFDAAFPLDLDLIEQIEVVRGPSSSVYGGDSSFGVINVITRTGASLHGIETAASLGSGAASDGRVSWGKAIEGGGDLTLSYTSSHASGRQLAFPEVGAAGIDTMAQHVGGEQGGKLFARFRSEEWRATLIHSAQEKTVPTGSYATIFNDTNHRETDIYTLVEVANDHQLSSKSSLHTRVYGGQYEYKGEFPYDYPPQVLNLDRAIGQWWGFESRLLTTIWHGHRWIAGIEYKANVRQNQRNDDQGIGCFGLGATPCLNDRRQSHQESVYAQDEIALSNATFLTLGFRYDQLSDSHGHWSPRLGLVHQNEQGGTFKLLYATAFSDPTVYQRYYTMPSFTVGNPDLKSENMRSLDLTWEQRLGVGSQVSTSLYFFKLKDLVGISPTTGGYINFPEVTGRGLEIEYQHRWGDRSKFRVGYSLQQISMASGDLENVPRHSLHGNLAVPVFNSAWFAGLEGQLVSSRRTGNIDTWVPGYTVVNTNLSYRPFGRDWDASLGIYNLFNHQYVDPVALDSTVGAPRDRMLQFGRSFRLKLTLRF